MKTLTATNANMYCVLSVAECRQLLRIAQDASRARYEGDIVNHACVVFRGNAYAHDGKVQVRFTNAEGKELWNW